MRYFVRLCVVFFILFRSVFSFYAQCISNIVSNGSLDGVVDSGRPANEWTTYFTDPDLTDNGVLPYNSVIWANQPTASYNGGTWQIFAGPFEYIEQSFDLEIGSRYILELEYVSQSIINTISNDTIFGEQTGVIISLDDVAIFQSEIDTTYFTWESACFSFVASESESVLRISGISDFGYLGVDGVCLIKDPNQLILNDTTLCIGETLELNFGDFLISDTSWVSDTTDLDNIVITEESSYWIDIVGDCGNYRKEFMVDIEDCGCSLFLSNIFSPNEIGDNSVFKVNSSCPILTYKIEVYDRWGNQVFQSQSLQDSWLGDSAEVGVYVYYIRYSFDDQNFKVASGDVFLVK